MRVLEELTHHPKGTRLVAEGHVESGDRDGGPASNRELELAAAIRGRNLPQPDEGQTTEFTMDPEVESLTRGSATAPQPLLILMPATLQCQLPVPTFNHGLRQRRPL